MAPFHKCAIRNNKLMDIKYKTLHLMKSYMFVMGPLRWPGWSRSETLAPRTNRGLHRALIEVCTAHLHSAFAQRICTAHLHSAFAQRICTAHYYGMSDLLVTSSYIYLLKRGPNPILFLMMHRNDPEIESKAKLMTRACCNT